MKNAILIILIGCSFSALLAQDFTAAQDRLNGFEIRKGLTEKSKVANLPFENIGPTIFSGRVTDVAVNPNDPTQFYVAYASGGLWKTMNNGTTFDPIFDNEAVMTIGAIAADWENNTIWVGTGEVNSSRSSYAGLGMYKSTDGGETWIHKGLEDSHHIGRIILHPENPDHVSVAVLGHLYSYNAERGVFKTTDGGDSWDRTLYVDNKSGAVDLVIDPNDSNILYAATWERLRKAWDFIESGSGSGIYKSTDAGQSYSLLTTAESGFPTGEGVGRIGLTMHADENGSTLYALLDNYNRRPAEKKDVNADLVKDDFKEMSEASFKALSDEKLNKYLRSNRFPKKYNAKKVRSLLKTKKIAPADLATYLEDANRLLFDTPVIAAELYVMKADGKFSKTHEEYINGLYNSYGYYFGVVKVDPSNVNNVYLGGVPILASDDGGKTFKSINGDNVHSDHHIIWVNPDKPGHIINGNDGGINISYDNGENWIKCNSPSVGQFYYINVDNAEPYNVYGGLQDNGVWKGSNEYRSGTRWHSSGRYPYQSIMGGDGMQMQIDPRNTDIVYTGFQFGNYFRTDASKGERKRITPIHELGERPYRWNWQTPIHLSVHNSDILYMGAQKLFRSMDKGENFKAISEDLTQGGKPGDVPFGTLSYIHESDRQFGLIYVGSDDGLVHVTRDGGVSWNNISDGLPEDLWVSRVQASMHQDSTVYLSLNGYRSDDFKAYVYKSTNLGEEWIQIGQDLPDEPVNVIKEDPKSPGILYVGTDHGTYVSMDDGESFMSLSEGLPAVAVHDLVVHPTADDLLIGTHGRSIYKANIASIRSLGSLDDDLAIMHVQKMKHNSRWGSQRASYRDAFVPDLSYQVYSDVAGSATLRVKTESGIQVFEESIELKKGLSNYTYHLEADASKASQIKSAMKLKENMEAADNGKMYLPQGKYTLEVVRGANRASADLMISK